MASKANRWQAGPFTYKTGEVQDIKVSVLARLPWPFGLTFLPDATC